MTKLEMQLEKRLKSHNQAIKNRDENGGILSKGIILLLCGVMGYILKASMNSLEQEL